MHVIVTVCVDTFSRTYCCQLIADPGGDGDVENARLGDRDVPQQTFVRHGVCEVRNSECRSLICASRTQETPKLIWDYVSLYSSQFREQLLYAVWLICG